LENHLHLAALRAQFFSTQREKIAAFETDFTSVGLDQPQEHARQRGFPASALADDAKVSPREMEKLTPSTAVKRAPSVPCEKTPPLAGRSSAIHAL